MTDDLHALADEFDADVYRVAANDLADSALEQGLAPTDVTPETFSVDGLDMSRLYPLIVDAMKR